MRVCLNMIVRNEAAVIARCLRSVRPYIDAWAIADTGSTDGTQNLIRSTLDDLPGELIERPWVDFAHNRNEALELARRHGEYALFIDADDVWEAQPGFRLPGLGATDYAIETVFQGVVSSITALARLDIDWRWEGVLHEVLTASPGNANVPLRGVRLKKFADGGRSQMPAREKYARDAAVLRAALATEPGNLRYQFYLAQSLFEAGKWSEAISVFRQRAAAGGWDEEVYFSKLMIAILNEQLGTDDAAVVEAYRDAWTFRPQRAESPMRLAHFFIKRRRFAEARDCAQAACALPPSTDRLFVDRTASGWRSLDDLAVALFHLGDLAGAVGAYRRMLHAPELPEADRARVLRNLAKLGEKA